jgi:hypothetical protein
VRSAGRVLITCGRDVREICGRSEMDRSVSGSRLLADFAVEPLGFATVVRYRILHYY